MRESRFDVWVCEGRMCRANGADDVTHACAHELDGQERARLHRGGCYGLCDLGPNVIIRRRKNAAVDVDADRLSLTEGDNEYVSCGVTPADVPELLSSFLVDDAPLLRLSRAVKESNLTPRSTIEARMRALRQQRRAKG
ncbi:MAG: (2Fe-2S) ferredoxin domain-containing protein [Deltaproteobacteria bacterium]|nr:(2Fe-2S) ferredoxin domain-containing protein [Deltaproteobacteria bacterium]